jgi:hypothetical protein
MDFASLPPEINSARMHTGPGSAPMLATAAAWDDLALELHSTAAAYGSVIAELTGGAWSGPASASMAAAVAPYVAWLTSTAGQAEQSANQAWAAAAAYETAFAMTVPPPVIAANRSLLASLVATNFLGQNTPAIACTEAHYAQMWAQDVAAMQGYAGSSAGAAQLTPFTPPAPTTNAEGLAAQSRRDRPGRRQRPRHFRTDRHINGPAAAFRVASGAAKPRSTDVLVVAGGPTGPVGPVRRGPGRGHRHYRCGGGNWGRVRRDGGPCAGYRRHGAASIGDGCWRRCRIDIASDGWRRFGYRGASQS